LPVADPDPTIADCRLPVADCRLPVADPDPTIPDCRLPPPMFVSQAHSFTQQARLAITLAWVAGYTNVVTILAFGSVTSHASGTTSLLGEFVAQGQWAAAGAALYLIGMFTLGAMLSALSTETGRRRGWESVYVLPMALETLLLALVALGLELQGPTTDPGLHLSLMLGLAACAMGLQNATITRISSGVVRTTHVTGVLTDLGAELVQLCFWLADRRADIQRRQFTELARSIHASPGARLALLASIVGSFALGAGLGTLVFGYQERFAMVPPVVFLLWIIYQDMHAPIAEIEPSRLVAENNLTLPPQIAVYALAHSRRRPGRIHGLPDLISWAERLPPVIRVIILDMQGVAQLDAESAPQLRALMAMLKATGRSLVLAGLDSDRYSQLSMILGPGVLTPDHALPDLELAIARGINLLDELAH